MFTFTRCPRYFQTLLLVYEMVTINRWLLLDNLTEIIGKCLFLTSNITSTKMNLSCLGKDMVLTITDHLDLSYRVVLWRTSRSFSFLFRSLPKKSETCRIAASGGSVDLMIYFRELGCRWDSSVAFAAVTCGDLPMLRYLREGITPSDEDEVLSVRRVGICPWVVDECSLIVAEKGHLDILEYMYDKGCRLAIDVPYRAALYGHRHILWWLSTSEIYMDIQRVCETAASGGHLGILKIYYDPWKAQFSDVAVIAAERGYLDILLWMNERNYIGRLSKNKCITIAVERGHQHIVDWLTSL